MDFVFSQMLPPIETGMAKRTNALSREATGGLTRCGEAVGPQRSGLAERGKMSQPRDWRSLAREICPSLAALRIEGEGRKRHWRRRAAQKDRASLAGSGSNPDRDDRAKSRASNCSTASPVLVSSWHRSQMHTRRERLKVPPEKLP